jgi:hypothetical protein
MSDVNGGERLSDYVPAKERPSVDQAVAALARVLELRRDGATRTAWLSALDTLHDRLLALADHLRPAPSGDGSWTRVPLEHQPLSSGEPLTWSNAAGWYCADAAALIFDVRQRDEGRQVDANGDPPAGDDALRPLEVTRHAIEVTRQAFSEFPEPDPAGP